MMVSGHYVGSEEVTEFERAFARYLGCPSVVGMNSGTDALLCSLRALGVQRNQEVITHANTFNATVSAICLAGLRPVLVDADESSFLLNTDQAFAAIGPKTRIVLPVHLYGKPTPMRPMLGECAKRGIDVVEDAAQAHGARIENQRIGTFGVLGCFSFHPSKNLAAAGDAGAVAVNRPDLGERLSIIHALGQASQNDHVQVGYNSKLDSLQAKVLVWKLPALDRWNEQRRSIARMYRQMLADLPVRFQLWDENEEHVFHLFAIRSQQRDRLLEHLRSKGVDAVVRYPVPIHLQPAFSEFGWKPGQFPVAESLARELLCLPMRQNLTTSEVEYVSDCVRSFFKSSTK